MIITSIEDMESDKMRHELRTFDIIDYDKLNEYIKCSQELKNVFKLNDLNRIAQRSTEITQEALKYSTQTLRFKVKNKNKKNKMIPWLNRRIRIFQNKKK